MVSVAYFLGTFNPIHIGHLLLAQCALQQCLLDKVIFVPAFQPPHRVDDLDLIDFRHRYHMTQLACQPYPSFQVWDIEAHLPAPSYTIDTLNALQPNNAPIPMIIGHDALAGLPSWKAPLELIERCLFLQAQRQGQPILTTLSIGEKAIPLNTRPVQMPQVDISATQIRQQLHAGVLPHIALPANVLDYITWNALYSA